MTRALGQIGDLGISTIKRELGLGRLVVHTGPLRFRIKTDFVDIAKSFDRLYSNHPYEIDSEFSDFYIEVRSPLNLRRWFRRQAEFFIDGDAPFEALPREQAPALLEWGMNWTIAASCNHWLTMHAACLEKNGSALILPAPPGSGKSTLTAALAINGWRLLSDELSLLDPDTLQANALARPINLKNESIDLLRKFNPDAVWSPETYDTKKGRVAHLAPPADSVERMLETATPRWIVFPRYVPNAEPLLMLRSKSQTFMHLAENSFNYGTLGETAFSAIGRLLDQCDCYDFTYSRLEDALEVFSWLSAESDTASLEIDD